MKQKKRVIHRLKGGLGNQLLQLLVLESLGYNYLLDISSGFHYDRYSRTPTIFLDRLGCRQLEFPKFVLGHRWLSKGFLVLNCLFRLRFISESYYFNELSSDLVNDSIKSFRSHLGIDGEDSIDLVIHYRDFLAEGSFEYENISIEWIAAEVDKLNVDEIVLIGNNLASLKNLKTRLAEDERRNIRLSTGTAEEDFALLSSAKNKILSYSTFSLAAALMSQCDSNLILPKINSKLEDLVPLYQVYKG